MSVKERKNEIKFFNVPISIQITLYKQNHIDNTLIGNVLRYANVIAQNDLKNKFIVYKKDLLDIINLRFFDEIEKFSTIPSGSLYSSVNSIYFLNKILNEFSNLEMIEINVSNSRIYSRLVSSGENSVIGFDYKITHGIVNYPDYIPSSDNRLNIMLSELGYSINSTPYLIVKGKDFIERLSHFEKTNKIAHTCKDIINISYELFEPKIEIDDTLITIILDYPIINK